MPDIDELIVSLKQSLEQTKIALNELLARKNEYQKQPNASPEKLEQMETEISALSNLIKQNEQAVESVLKLKESGETGDFYIAAERQNGGSF
jgi:DNA repair ATPase RecN